MTSLTPKRMIANRASRLYQNTYRLVSKNPFNSTKVKTKIQNIIEMNLQDVEITEDNISDLCSVLAGEIKNAVKEEQFDRYRIIVTVIIGQKKMQGIQICHSFLWDHEKDRYVEHTHETNNYYVQAVVYGIYID